MPHSGTLTFPVSVAVSDPGAGHNVGVVAAVIDAFNRRDWGTWEALSVADVEVDWSASQGLEASVYRGRQEVDRFLRTFELFESVVVKPERFIDAGDSVIVPNTTRFRGRAGLETVAWSIVGYELRDGYIARVCLYQDPAEAFDAAELWE